MTTRRERYDKISDLAWCSDCSTRMTMLKPGRVSLDNLNTNGAMDDENYFYICFTCKTITQIGYGDVQKMDLAATHGKRGGAAPPTRRERYDKVCCPTWCSECGTYGPMLKPERITLDDLNASAEVGDENYFYPCFTCKTIRQPGYDDVQEMSL